ncbi:MAG: hypothetical protein QM775_17980 [Pirellulales bacterium]
MSAATFVLVAGISGWNLVINATDTLVSLTATPFTPIYWRGGQNLSWATLGSGPANWTTDAAGLVDSNHTPTAGETVIFSASGASGTTFTTTLNAPFTIDSLQFINAPTGVTGAVRILSCFPMNLSNT